MKKNRGWSSFLAGGILLVLVACQSPNPKPAPSLTPTEISTETPPATAQPTLTSTPNPSPSSNSSPSPKPEPTNTPEVVSPIPAGWRIVGDERFGLQIAAPQGWIDATAVLRALEGAQRYGPQFLLTADSQETGNRFLTGTGPGEGAFVFGFLDKTVDSNPDPASQLLDLLAKIKTEGVLTPKQETIGQAETKAAFVDLSTDPLDLFPSLEQPLIFRVLTISDPETNTTAVFLMGSASEQWESNEEIFGQMLKTITFPVSNVNVYGHLESGDQVNGTLETESADLWTFNGQGGQYGTIRLMPNESSTDLTLKLFDPAGNVMVSMDNDYAGDSESLTDVLLPEDGTYVIEVSEFFNEEGPYQLFLVLEDEAQSGVGGHIEFAQEITADLSENSEQSWIFEGTAGQDISIVLTSLDDQLDVILEVRGPDGQQIIVLDEGFAGDAEVLTDLPLSVTGEYIILVQGFAGRGGSYSIYLDEGGESTVNFFDAGDLSYGDSAREVLREDEAHAWFFDGQIGDQVTIEVSPLEPNMDLDIWLLDPELNEVEMKDEFLSGEPEKIEQTLITDGQHLVLVREFFGESGQYEIVLNASGEEEVEIAGSMSYSQSVQGALPSGKQVGWTFDGREGDIIDVTLVPANSGRDLVIVLLDPSGEPMITVDATLAGLTERLIAYTLPSEGKWTILVQEFFNEASDYELTLTIEEQ